MSQTEENKELAKRWLDLISEGNVEEICELTAQTWIMHGGKPGMSPGPDGIRELFASFGEIKQTWALEDIIAEGNKVVIRATNSCQQESFFGIPSRGRWQHFSATFIHHIENGKFMETWRNADDLGRVLQLGAKLEPTQ
ncbi:ester cyclase [Spirosoma sp. KNUC1025]|uniref:ester cyclase n=1 Tax=Spirosoma sp. KNUC1025 TaxID=2894082 RepID=UPI0038636243|nr:ester cyclase [Spirosoma sp. KNUC1025]